MRRTAASLRMPPCVFVLAALAGSAAGLWLLPPSALADDVARSDYGVSLDREGDNTASRVHLTFGLPYLR